LLPPLGAEMTDTESHCSMEPGSFSAAHKELIGVTFLVGSCDAILSTDARFALAPAAAWLRMRSEGDRNIPCGKRWP